MREMKADELMQQVTDKVVKSIQDGMVTGKWVKPWQSNQDLYGFFAPSNVVTAKRYSGGNFLWLMWLGNEAGYDNGTWGTYKQWESLGEQVRKGETGTRCIKWVERRCKDHSQEESCAKCGKLFPTVFTVFNKNQTEGNEAKPMDPEAKIVNSEIRIEKYDVFFEALGGKVCHTSQGRAFYLPSSDEIHMPEFEDFIDASYYYSTLGHEYAHWTGHQSRLNREGVAAVKTDRELYAREELIAELASTMLCAVLGVEEQPREDHAQYLQAWLQHLSSDKWALFKAASQATKATEFLLSLGKLDEPKEVLEGAVA
jgi:antirestriction protein ArdC